MATITRFSPAAAAISASLITMVLAGCDEDAPPTDSGSRDSASQDESDSQESTSGQVFPDIVSVEVNRAGEASASFAVTVSSPYDSPQRYADGWRVLDQDGTVLGEHTLGHDHASEQPFTRTQRDVNIPEGTTRLTVEGRDQISGCGGETVSVQW